MSNEPYIRFISTAMDLVRKGQHINTRDSYIQALFEPSFNDPLLVQLNWNGKDVKWFRTTWLKTAETYDFSVVGSLKYLHDTPKPTIKYENGEADISRIESLMQLIRNISIPPRIDKPGFFALDGSNYTLTIGVDDIKTIYKWHTCPEEWQELQTITDMLYDLDLS
ncbi:MAG: hypothetical protein BGO55_06855 [Sphingobacteriales bacterium 50-39]|nr:hypothetical protein [Sphingobacteriales bacterium]OJW52972.1 MAG: hypothetical protein BGO55_06855 [Sphingobacteriales bacterium 50-39]